LNDGLPNLAVRRLISAPRGSNGTRAAILAGGRVAVFQWRSGENGGWTPVEDETLAREEAVRLEAADSLQVDLTTAAASGNVRYAGSPDGRLWASLDGGRNWRQSAGLAGGQVVRFWVDTGNPRSALAVVSAGPQQSKVLRTVNGGGWWDDLTANLEEARVFGITASGASGAIYLATSRGVLWTMGDLRAPTPATPWRQLAAGWTEGTAVDVRLDDPGHLLVVAVDGEGLYSTLAPHRFTQPVLVDAADLTERAVAPGSLVSLLGSRAEGVRVQGRSAAILAAQEAETQIQLPYALTGDRVEIEVGIAQRRLSYARTLKPASPAIMVASDGAPMVLDAESGLQVDTVNTARGGMKLQILMSGLGRVVPDWPVGMAAPLADAPRVASPVRVFLDGVELAVERATLAPGYIGYYLVEVRLPEFLPAGALELSVEASGERSNRVRLYASE
jgi:uncharacterized protein (TIGR03437 family)